MPLRVEEPAGISPVMLGIAVLTEFVGHQVHRALDERNVEIEHKMILRPSL